ncbi:unnamed protein product [Macrosiphum euphorbiae]|uniref:Uncharacterized protein n=1 Tax=Macrosiphum euphorbiae TaxID=13131 RepID=A0AAV0WDF6_9HEMI|nr:unnamed protein product [Macrosiphum euphorbiae]
MLNKDNDNIICNNNRRKEFFEKCRQFLQTASLELKKRYNMEDPILMQFHMHKIHCFETKKCIVIRV